MDSATGHVSRFSFLPPKLDSLLEYLIRFVLSPYVIFLALSLAIMGPLLLPGRILSLDSPLALNWDISGYFWGTSDGAGSVFAATYNSAPIALVLKALTFIIPFWAVEKVWLILLFWLCGIGASRLPNLAGVSRFYAGLLYTVNPFTYVRFISGQWGILGAYALMPFAVSSFIRLLEEPHPKQAIKTVLLLTIIGFLQIHGLVLALMVLVMLYISRTFFLRETLKTSGRIIILSVLLFFGLNLFWILRYILAGSGITNNMPVEEMNYFAASPPIEVLSLRGFWLDIPYTDISDLIPVWWILLFPILFLTILGSFTMLSTLNLRWLGLGLATTAIVCFVLAAGPGFPLTESLFRSLWEHFPAYRAFRDSYKFVAVLALAYAYFGAFGLMSLTNLKMHPKLWTKRLMILGVTVIFAIPIIYSLPLFGTWGQIKSSAFPTDWATVRSILDEDVEDYNVLVLPWHMYMDYNWLPNRWKRLANPAPNFFSQPTISGDNLEALFSPSNSSNPVSKYIESLLQDKESLQNFGSLIAPLNAKYVVLFNASDYQSYNFLLNQEDLDLIFEGNTIVLFRNLSPTNKAYSVKKIIYIDNLQDYLTKVSSPNPLDKLYVFRTNIPEPFSDKHDAAGEYKESKIVRINPVSYRAQTSDGSYLVFTVPQKTLREGWISKKSTKLLNLNMMPAFESTQGDTNIRFEPFYKLSVPTYILTIISLVVAFLVYKHRD